jgi:hypothetical protein
MRPAVRRVRRRETDFSTSAFLDLRRPVVGAAVSQW